MAKTTVIIDGNNYIHRSWHVASIQKSSSQYMHMYIFLTSVKKILNLFSPSDVIVCWDHRISNDNTNFRYIENPEYKGTRDQNKNDEVLKHSTALQNVLLSLGVENMFPNNMEADDVVSYLVDNLYGNKIICSADKDLLQFINEDVSVFNPNTKSLVTKENFSEVVGIDIKYYILYKSIIGDSSDNIKGLYKFGPVKTKKYIRGDFKLTDEQLKIVQNNINLIDLKESYLKVENEKSVLDEQLKRIKKDPIKSDWKEFETYCIRFGFNTILKNMPDWKNSFRSLRFKFMV